MNFLLSPSCACACAAWLLGAGLQAGADLRPEGQAVAEAPAREVQADDNRFDGIFARAMSALKSRSFEEARLLFVAAAESTDMKKHPATWQTAEFNACHALFLQGRKTEAEILAKQIAERCEAALGEEDPLTSEALAYFAYVLKQDGHLERAEPVYRRNVRLLEAKYGQDHYLVATAMSKHAGLLQSMGKLEEAEKIQRQAFTAMSKISDEQHPNFCYFLTNLGYCLEATGKHDEARGLMQKAFEIVQQTNDADLTSAGAILRKQAEYYRDVHELDRAEALGHRALLRLAKRPDINRSRFFHHDMVADVYRSILQARGLSGSEIDDQLRAVETEAATRNTASVSK